MQTFFLYHHHFLYNFSTKKIVKSLRGYDINTLILKKLWNKTGSNKVLYLSYKYPKNKEGRNTSKYINAKSFNIKWINVKINDDIILPGEMCRKIPDFKKLFILF